MKVRKSIGGNTTYYFDEKDRLHRDDGPAAIHNSCDRGELNTWYRHGKIHREDGPAIVWGNGNVEWWLQNKKHEFHDWLNAIEADTKTKLEYLMKWENHNGK